MASIIDNRNKTMLKSLINSLKQAKSVDILTKYDEYIKSYEELWNDSRAIDIRIKNGNNEFVEELKKKLWFFVKPFPYSIFIRILFELYDSIDNSKIKYYPQRKIIILQRDINHDKKA